VVRVIDADEYFLAPVCEFDDESPAFTMEQAWKLRQDSFFQERCAFVRIPKSPLVGARVLSGDMRISKKDESKNTERNQSAESHVESLTPFADGNRYAEKASCILRHTLAVLQAATRSGPSVQQTT
jgi:hypothetical protein